MISKFNRRKRSKPAISIIVTSIIYGSAGIFFALTPNAVLDLIGYPIPTELWIRLFGTLIIVLGIKGIQEGLKELTSSMQLTVYTRIGFSVFLTVLLILGIAHPIFIIFLINDLIAAVWIQLVLHSEKKAQR